MVENSLKFDFKSISGNLAIVGDPGTGKTVLSKILIKNAVDENRKSLVFSFNSNKTYDNLVKSCGGCFLKIDHIADTESESLLNEFSNSNLLLIDFKLQQKSDVNLCIQRVLELASKFNFNTIFLRDQIEFEVNPFFVALGLMVNKYENLQLVAGFTYSICSNEFFKSAFPNVFAMRIAEGFAIEILSLYNIHENYSSCIFDLSTSFEGVYIKEAAIPKYSLISLPEGIFEIC